MNIFLKKLKKRVYTVVQGSCESGAEFSEYINKVCSDIDSYPIDIQFTSAENGRQTANIMWYEEVKPSVSYNKNFISSDLKSAINSYGKRFEVGDVVTHEGSDIKGERAVIFGFSIDQEKNEVRVDTDKGYAHIDFIDKVNERTT